MASSLFQSSNNTETSLTLVDTEVRAAAETPAHTETWLWHQQQKKNYCPFGRKALDTSKI
jgi:hypothetical protein